MPNRPLPGLRESREGRVEGRPRSRLTGFLVVTTLVWTALGHAAAPPVPLLPIPMRPFVLVDPLKGMGLLLPSGQEALKVVVVGIGRRYGNDFIAIEDELLSAKRLRRMAGKSNWLPADAQRAQDMRLALLEWAVKEAPYRITIGFKSAGRGKGYIASAECRERGAKKPIHRIEGVGKTYDAAVSALEKKVPTFCAVLDGAAAERKRGILSGATPPPAPAAPPPATSGPAPAPPP